MVSLEKFDKIRLDEVRSDKRSEGMIRLIEKKERIDRKDRIDRIEIWIDGCIDG